MSNTINGIPASDPLEVAFGEGSAVGIDQTTPGTTNGIVLKPNPSTTAVTLGGGIKVVAAAGTPEALGSGLVESVAIKPNKARSTANTGTVYVGFGATNDTQQLWELPATGATPLCFGPIAGKKYDLATIFIDVVTDGDGVVFFTVN